MSGGRFSAYTRHTWDTVWAANPARVAAVATVAIVLVATDSDGMVGTATVRVYVGRPFYLPLIVRSGP